MSRAEDPPPVEGRMHRLSLRFDREELEASFRRAYARRFLPHQRISLLLGLVLYASFGALDPYIIPEAKHVAWGVRFGLICPLVGAAYVLSHARWFEAVAQPVLACLGFAGGLGVIAMTHAASGPGRELYYLGLMIVCVYVCTFFRLRFVPAMLSSWGLVLCCEVLAVGAWDMPVPVIVNNTAFLVAINVTGTSACYAMERSVRADFLQERIIRGQAEQLSRALAEVKTLTGLLPICAWCKSVRDDRGYWSQIEEYLKAHSSATLSHGICPQCLERVRAESREHA